MWRCNNKLNEDLKEVGWAGGEAREVGMIGSGESGKIVV